MDLITLSDSFECISDYVKSKVDLSSLEIEQYAQKTKFETTLVQSSAGKHLSVIKYAKFIDAVSDFDPEILRRRLIPEFWILLPQSLDQF